MAAVGPAGAGQVLAAVAATTPNTSKRDAAASDGIDELSRKTRGGGARRRWSRRVVDSHAASNRQIACATRAPDARRRRRVHRGKYDTAAPLIARRIVSPRWNNRGRVWN